MHNSAVLRVVCLLALCGDVGLVGGCAHSPVAERTTAPAGTASVVAAPATDPSAAVVSAGSASVSMGDTPVAKARVEGAPVDDAQAVRAQAGEGVHPAAAWEAKSDDFSPADSSDSELQGPHPVDYYVQLALARNPEIRAAERSVSAQAEVVPQVTELDDPTLTESFQPFTNHSVQTAAGRGVNVLSLSQKFPWYGKLRVRGEVAREETRMALARLASVQLEVIEEVKLSYLELYYTQRAIEITEQDEKLLDRILQFVNARFQANRAPLQDLLRVRIEKRKVQDRLISLRRQMRQAQADLAEVIQATPQADLKAQGSVTESVPRELDQLYTAAVQCRPELREKLHAIIRDRRRRELARLDFYPDVTVGVGWQAIAGDEALSDVANGNDNVQFSVGMNLPVWREKLRAGVREADQRIFASSRRYDAERDDTFRQIRRLIVQARALDEQLRLFREQIIPDSESTVKLLFARYRSQQADIQDVLDNYSRLLAYHIQVIRLEASLGQTLASLERVVGCQLTLFREKGQSNGANDEQVPPNPLPPAPRDD